MAYLATALDVAERMSERGMSLRLDDMPNAISRCLQRATTKVYQKLLPAYLQSDLMTDALSGGADGTGGMVKDLAVDLAVCELARRRGNAVAQTWKDVCKEANEMLDMLRNDVEQLPNVPSANPQYPVWSNVRVMAGYVYKQVRVEVNISDMPPPGGAYAQAVDFLSQSYLEY